MTFCDNLDSQMQIEFLNALNELNSSRHLLVGRETEMLQPIDSGPGSIIGQVQDERLDVEKNLDAWDGDPNAQFKIDARMRRILITKWVGEAWERLVTDLHHKDTFSKCFQQKDSASGKKRCRRIDL